MKIKFCVCVCVFVLRVWWVFSTDRPKCDQLHDFHTAAEQRMHLAHLEAGLLEDEWKEESNPMPLAAMQVQHQYLEPQGGEGIVSVCRTLCEDQPTTRALSTPRKTEFVRSNSSSDSGNCFHKIEHTWS